MNKNWRGRLTTARWFFDDRKRNPRKAICLSLSKRCGPHTPSPHAVFVREMETRLAREKEPEESHNDWERTRSDHLWVYHSRNEKEREEERKKEGKPLKTRNWWLWSFTRVRFYDWAPYFDCFMIMTNSTTMLGSFSSFFPSFIWWYRPFF